MRSVFMNILQTDETEERLDSRSGFQPSGSVGEQNGFMIDFFTAAPESG